MSCAVARIPRPDRRYGHGASRRALRAAVVAGALLLCPGGGGAEASPLGDNAPSNSEYLDGVSSAGSFTPPKGLISLPRQPEKRSDGLAPADIEAARRWILEPYPNSPVAMTISAPGASVWEDLVKRYRDAPQWSDRGRSWSLDDLRRDYWRVLENGYYDDDRGTLESILRDARAGELGERRQNGTPPGTRSGRKTPKAAGMSKPRLFIEDAVQEIQVLEVAQVPGFNDVDDAGILTADIAEGEIAIEVAGAPVQPGAHIARHIERFDKGQGPPQKGEKQRKITLKYLILKLASSVPGMIIFFSALILVVVSMVYSRADRA